MNYLLSGMRRAVRVSREHHFLVILLVVLQMALVVGMGYLLLVYPVRILADIQGLIEPLQDASAVDATSNLSQDQMQSFYQAYISLKRNILELGVWMGIGLLLWSGSTWSIMRIMLEGQQTSWKESVRYLMRWGSAVVMFMVPLILGGFYYLKRQIGQGVSPDVLLKQGEVLLVIWFILYYGMMVAFALVGAVSWKEYYRQWFSIAILRIHKTMLVGLINFTLIGAFGYLLYVAVSHDWFFGVTLLLVLSMVLLLVLTRLFWVACLQELIHEKNHH